MSSESWDNITNTIRILKKFFFGLLIAISVYSILVFWGVTMVLDPELEVAAIMFALGIYFSVIMIFLFHIAGLITKWIRNYQYQKEMEVFYDKPKRKIK